MEAIRQFSLINQTGHGRGGQVELLSSDKMPLPPSSTAIPSLRRPSFRLCDPVRRHDRGLVRTLRF